MINIVDLSHQILTEFNNPKVAIDMTCGNGYDTIYLSKIADKVYAFDIQTEAIKNTTKLLDENKVQNVTVIKESHDLFDIFVSENIDLVIYNLGYLPSGNKDIKTEALIVINSLEKVLYQLNTNGIVVIVIYLHNTEESNKIENYINKLSSNFDVMKYQVLNKSDCPYILRINKCK